MTVILSLTFVFITGPLVTNAVEQEVTTTTELVQSDNEQDTATADENVISEEEKSQQRAARIEEYKQKKIEKLAETQAKRVASRCKSAQGKITSLRSRISSTNENRRSVYRVMGEKLDKLVERLVKAGIDTTKLDTAREDIQADLKVLNASMESYNTVLVDIEEMKCQEDPEAFQAALEEARVLLKTLREQAQEFRRFSTNELRTILQELKIQLEAKKTVDQDTLQQTQTTGGQN